MNDILEVMQAGLEHHRAGRLPEAEAHYRRALALHPRHAPAAHLLGLLAYQAGKSDIALGYLEQAVKFDPFQALYRADLAQVQIALHRTEQAGDSLRMAIELNPRLATAHARMGALLEKTGSAAEGQACYQRALAIDPQCAEAHAALGSSLLARGQIEGAQESLVRAAHLAPQNVEVYLQIGNSLVAQHKLRDAIACYVQAVQLQPDSYAGHFHLASAYQARAQLERAAAHYSRAAELAPQSAEAHYRLGIVRHDQGRLEDALACLRRAIECADDLFDAHRSLAELYFSLQRPDESAAAARRAVELRPQSAWAATCLARALHLQGNMREAIDAFRRAVELAPDNAVVHSNWLYALHGDPAVDAKTIADEHRAWAARHAEPLSAGAPPHANDRTLARRLRIGYVSPHLRNHAVSFFSRPLLEAHDRGAFEIFLYSDSNVSDETTGRLKRSADHWRPIAGLSDEDVAEAVRRDQIDILVDLAGHLGGNRLLMFARKPAPIQVTYLGYPNTTGMSAMDYRLSDAHANPPGADDALYSEQIVRLPGSFFCYAPSEPSPNVGELPALAAGHVTFGWLNTTMKVTPEALATCGQIMAALPEARMIFLAYRGGAFEERVRTVMTDAAVAAERVEIVDWCSQEDYMRLHQRIDLALDSFPFNGHTTVCNALWMGVPSVVLEGTTYASRFGGSALINLGLDDFIARSRDEYLRIAVAKAGDITGLAELRRGLRARMAQSPLMDAAAFARGVEDAYRQMWRAWCER